VIPARPVDLAQALPPGEDPEVLARFAVLIAAADGELVEHERVWLRSLEQALVLPGGRTAELEREIFPPGRA
jgi:tellurite resistance protein